MKQPKRKHPAQCGKKQRKSSRRVQMMKQDRSWTTYGSVVGNDILLPGLLPIYI